MAFIKEGKKRNQYLGAICVSLGAMCAGSVLAWTSPVLRQLVKENASDTKKFTLTEAEGSVVGSLLAIGALLFAIPAGLVTDQIGRKYANILIAIFYIISYLLIVFAVGPSMLYVARLLAGVGTAAVCVSAPMYIGEISEASIRGRLGSFLLSSICLGILLTYSIGAVTSWIKLSWILMLVPITFGVGMLFMPDTPTYLIKSKRNQNAEKSLRFFRGAEHNIEAEFKAIQTHVAKTENKQKGINGLLTVKSNRRALLSCLGIMVSQQLSGYNAVIFHSVTIFNSAGISFKPKIAATVLVQFITGCIAAAIIEIKSRRFYLTLSATGMAICLAALGVCFHLKANDFNFVGIGIILLASLVGFIIAFSLGVGPIPWLMMGELFAPEVKGVGCGVTVFTNWIMILIVALIFPIMNTNLDGHITFYIYAVIAALSIVFVHLYIPETRGQTLQEIQTILNS